MFKKFFVITAINFSLLLVAAQDSKDAAPVQQESSKLQLSSTDVKSGLLDVVTRTGDIQKLILGYLSWEDYRSLPVPRSVAVGNQATCLKFSPLNRYLVSGHQHGSIELWDIVNGWYPTTLSMGRGNFPGISKTYAISSLAFAHMGKKLITVWVDGTLGVWDLATKKLEQEGQFSGDTVSVMPNGMYALYKKDGDGTISIINPTNLKVIKTFRNIAGQSNMSELFFTPDSEYLSALTYTTNGAGNKIYELNQWNLKTGQLSNQILFDSKIIAITMSPTGKNIAYVTYSRSDRKNHLAVIDTKTFKLCNRISSERLKYTNAITYSPQEDFIATTADTQYLVSIWNSDTLHNINEIFVGTDHPSLSQTNTIAFSPCGNFLVSVGCDTLRILPKQTVEIEAADANNMTKPDTCKKLTAAFQACTIL